MTNSNVFKLDIHKWNKGLAIYIYPQKLGNYISGGYAYSAFKPHPSRFKQ